MGGGEIEKQTTDDVSGQNIFAKKILSIEFILFLLNKIKPNEIELNTEKKTKDELNIILAFFLYLNFKQNNRVLLGFLQQDEFVVVTVIVVVVVGCVEEYPSCRRLLIECPLSPFRQRG